MVRRTWGSIHSGMCASRPRVPLSGWCDSRPGVRLEAWCVSGPDVLLDGSRTPPSLVYFSWPGVRLVAWCPSGPEVRPLRRGAPVGLGYSSVAGVLLFASCPHLARVHPFAGVSLGGSLPRSGALLSSWCCPPGLNASTSGVHPASCCAHLGLVVPLPRVVCCESVSTLGPGVRARLGDNSPTLG